MAVSNSIDRFNGLVASLAIKAPCAAVALVNITLSGEQTVNGVPVVTDDRVLVTAQTSGVDNGIYDVDTSAWSRAADFDGNRDIVNGTWIIIDNGTAYQITTNNPITIDTTAIAFAQVSGIIDSGSFTPAWFGFSVNPPATTVFWARSGNLVTLRFQGTPQGTSDNVTWRLTNVPVEITPTQAQSYPIIGLIDNGVLVPGVSVAQVTASGQINFGFGADNPSGGGWTAAGDKGFSGSFSCFTYSLDTLA